MKNFVRLILALALLTACVTPVFADGAGPAKPIPGKPGDGKPTLGRVVR